MKKNRWLMVLASTVIFVSLILTACGPPQADETTSSDSAEAEGQAGEMEQVLTMPLMGEPPTLDPHNGSDMLSSAVINGIFEGLIRIENGAITPGMAESWEVSDDGLTYTFHIRDDAKWWDGKDLTADDFVYGLIRLIDPNPPAPNGDYAFQGFYMENGEAFYNQEITDPSKVGVKALDSKTLQIKLVDPVPYFVGLMDFCGFYPCREDFIDEYGIEYASSVEKIMGNGPYVLKSWNHEQSVVLEKNPNYWNKDNVKLDRVEMIIIADQNTAINMFENGELDFANIPKDLIPQYKEAGKAEFFGDGVEFWMEFNLTNDKPVGKFLRNDNFRHAMGFAIDRQAYVDAVYKDGSQPAMRYVAPVLSIGDMTWGEKYDYAFYPPNADVEKAKQLLDKALDEIGATKEDIPVIEFITDDRPDRKLSAEAIQDMLDKTLGIKLDIKLVQTKQRYQLMKEMNYDIVWAGFGPDYDDPMTYLDRLMSDSGLNWTGFASEEYDNLIRFAKTSLDRDKRAEAMFKAERIMTETGPLVPVYFRNTAWTRNPKLKSLERSGMRADPDYTNAYFEE